MREPFIPGLGGKGDVKLGNHAEFGRLLPHCGDELWFYVSGPGRHSRNHKSGVSVTGLAPAPRWLVSLELAPEEATLTHRPLKFQGGHFFRQRRRAKGELRVEVQDQAARHCRFEAAACEPMARGFHQTGAQVAQYGRSGQAGCHPSAFVSA